MWSKFRIVLAVFVLGTLLQCQSDKPDEIGVGPIPERLNRVIIANEGNFMFGNASLSAYNTLERTVSHNTYQQVNNQALGDVLQSISSFQNSLFLVLNNSNNIVVVNRETLEEEARIIGLTSPRYLEMGLGNQAYVSDLYANGISVVDISLNQVVDFISIPSWTEKMVRINETLFVSTMNHNQLYLVDCATQTLTDSLTVGYSTNSMVVDAIGRLWLLSSGDASNGILAALHCVNTTTKAIENSWTFLPGSGYSNALQLNPQKDSLYFLMEGIVKMAADPTAELPTTPYVEKFWLNAYSLGVSPHTGELYLGDALDFVQRGTIYRFNNTSVTDSFKSGIIPGSFHFH